MLIVIKLPTVPWTRRNWIWSFTINEATDFEFAIKRAAVTAKYFNYSRAAPYLYAVNGIDSAGLEATSPAADIKSQKVLTSLSLFVEVVYIKHCLVFCATQTPETRPNFIQSTNLSRRSPRRWNKLLQQNHIASHWNTGYQPPTLLLLLSLATGRHRIFPFRSIKYWRFSSPLVARLGHKSWPPKDSVPFSGLQLHGLLEEKMDGN